MSILPTSHFKVGWAAMLLCAQALFSPLPNASAASIDVTADPTWSISGSLTMSLTDCPCGIDVVSGATSGTIDAPALQLSGSLPIPATTYANTLQGHVAPGGNIANSTGSMTVSAPGANNSNLLTIPELVLTGTAVAQNVTQDLRQVATSGTFDVSLQRSFTFQSSDPQGSPLNVGLTLPAPLTLGASTTGLAGNILNARGDLQLGKAGIAVAATVPGGPACCLPNLPLFAFSLQPLGTTSADINNQFSLSLSGNQQPILNAVTLSSVSSPSSPALVQLPPVQLTMPSPPTVFTVNFQAPNGQPLLIGLDLRGEFGLASQNAVLFNPGTRQEVSFNLDIGSGQLVLGALPPAPASPLPSPVNVHSLADADAFVRTQRVRDLALFSIIGYQPVGSVPITMPAGYAELAAPNGVGTLPAGLSIRTFGNTTGNNIVVEIRGTVPLLSNGVADVGFGTRTATMAQYVQAASNYFLALQAQHPGATFTITGHSLGAGIAEILGQATGFDTVGFNSPGISQAISLYSAESASLRAQNASNLKADNSNLLNFSMQGDPISRSLTQIGLLGQVGQVVELKTDAFGSLAIASQDVKNQVANVRNGVPMSTFYDHSMGTMLRQLDGINSGQVQNPVGSYTSSNGTLTTGQSVANATRELILNALLAPVKVFDTVGQTVATYSQSVRAFFSNIFDPKPATSYVFRTGKDDPNFAFFGFGLPQSAASQGPFKLDLLVNGSWQFAGNIDQLSEYFFQDPTGVTAFRISGIDTSNLDPTDLLVVDLGFVSDGTFTGDITAFSATPEPGTLLLFGTTMAALACAMRRVRLRR